MKGSWAKITVPAFCIAIALTGCNTNMHQKAQTKPVRIQSHMDTQHGTHHANITESHPHVDNIKVIPHFNGDKVRTTNKNGTTYSGMGSGIYSRIGTSSLHDTPESITLENRLESAGITGVKVLALGDSVYIGDPEKHTHTNNSKPQPHKVLSPNEGASGKGYMSQKGTGYSIGSRDINESNLSLIHQEVNGVYGKKVKLYTVHDPKAIQTIEKVKTALRAGKSVKQMNRDMQIIKKNAQLHTTTNHQAHKPVN
ncbi:hypothetical protein GRF59_17310 [Paenibacillus sp. HJL G12]|uniref:Uncharacterized protein n=1 Tax=Paenibacillus dendrobii TaxID=2691084 RepID=A0A7X3LJB9_9BACL|nr:hypothetical protein [Paenibacillus dendrobii]MWV45383.1 hypothetical protein [Paenibacillus dendrobii]